MDETFAQGLRRLRSARALTQEQLGALVGYTSGYISDLELGRRLPHHRLAVRFDGALGAGGLLVHLADAPPPVPLPAALTLPVDSNGLTIVDSDLTRPLNTDDVTHLHNTISHLVALDTSFGGSGIADTAVRAWRSAEQRLATGRYQPAVERDLQSVVAELGEVAGWLLYDAGRPDESRQTSVQALLTARLAGDINMERFILGNLGMLDIRQGRHGEVLRLADLALATGPEGRAAAVFHLRRGRALAELGGDGEALREMRRARSLLGASLRDGEDWSWWLHNAELTLHEAKVDSAVGRHERAVQRAHTSVAALPERQGRDRTVYRACALEVLIAAQAWTDAEQMVIELWSADVVPPRAVRMLAGVARQVSRPDSGAPAGLVEAVQDWSQHVRLLPG